MKAYHLGCLFDRSPYRDNSPEWKPYNLGLGLGSLGYHSLL